tara:strand:+ start:124 stop:477 length:354 start_codon:yes stop_codon:yes gene_type:complete
MATPGPYVRGALRNVLGFGSMLAGGALVHNYYAPDLVSCCDRMGTAPVAMFARSPCAHAHALAQTVPALDDSAASPIDPIEGYDAASSFQGARKGYAFKTGAAGLGYYPDKGSASKK